MSSKSGWHRGKGKGRVVLKTTPGGDTTKASIAGIRARAQRRALGKPEIQESPVSNWRESKYAKKGIRKPKHPRVRLRETVAREAREIQDKARRLSEAALDRMGHIVNNDNAPENAQIAAAVVILERAYGKPNQTNTNLNIDANGKTNEVSGDELNNRINETLRAIEVLTGRTRKAPKGKEQPVDLRQRHRNPDGSEPSVN